MITFVIGRYSKVNLEFMKRYFALVLVCGLLSISAYAKPVADFSASPSEGCSPLIVKFNNHSGNAVRFKWDFGNGNTSTLENPSAIYYVPGIYTVKLIAFDAGGKSDTMRRSGIRVFSNPKANFTADITSICEGQSVQFKNLSLEGDTQIAIYTYDFGNGKIGTSENPAAVYPKNGLITVGLHVVDYNGCESDTVFQSYIRVRKKPVAKFTTSDSQYCAIPAKVTFTNRSDKVKPHQYVWLFGDGERSTMENVDHEYNEFGNYPVRLITIGANGCVDTFDKASGIKVQPLKVDFKEEKNLCGPGIIEFLNLSDAAYTGISFLWDFGNGKSATTRNASVHLDTGKHKIKLVAYAGSCYAEKVKEINVFAKPEGVLLFNPPVICHTPQEFTARLSDSTGGNSRRYIWYGINNEVISNERVLNYTYLGTGIRRFTLEVTNGGCTAVFKDSLETSPPHVTILPDHDTGGCAPFRLDFNSLVQSKYPIIGYQWTFGDGTSSSDEQPRHYYPNPGKYKVTLTVQNIYGCEADTFIEILVGVKIPPDFTFDTSAVCNGELIHFINKTNESPYPPDSYVWSLVDLVTGKEEFLPFDREREFDYKSKLPPGDYEAQLTTIHNRFCRDSFTFPFPIHIKAPLSKPEVRYDSCGPTEVTFLNQSMGETSFVWLEPEEIRGSTKGNLTRVLGPGKYNVLLAAYSSKTGCRDTTPLEFEISQKPEINLQWQGDLDCPPVTLLIKSTQKATGNFELRVNGVKERFYGLPTSPWSIEVLYDSLPSTFDITWYADNYVGCIVRDTLHLKGKGPVADGEVEVEGECLPATVKLKDLTFGSDTFDHYWMIGNKDPIKVTSGEMTTQITEMESGSDSISIRLWVGSGKCHDVKNFRIPVEGIHATIETIMSGVYCNEIMFHVKAVHSGETDDDSLLYWWGVNSTWYKEYRPLPTYATIRKLDSNTDTLRLRIKSARGCETEIYKLLEKPEPKLVPDFTADVTGSICPPLNVQFTDKTTSDSKITNWEWEMGDDTRSTLQNPRRVYMEPGKYPVSLTVTDEKGCKVTVTYPDFITIEGPKALVDIQPKTGCVPLTVKFNATSDEEVMFKWDLGDGKLFQGNDFEYTYSDAGRYIPLLTISDSFGCSYTVPPGDTIVVSDYPEFEIAYDGFCAGQPMLLKPLGIADTGSIKRIIWYLGDGTTDTGFNINHTYESPGVYKVEMLVENQYGCISEVSMDVRITGADPHFITDKKVACANETILVTYDGTPQDGLVISKWWLDSVGLDHTNTSFEVQSGQDSIRSLAVEVRTADGCIFRYEDSHAIVYAGSDPPGMAEIRRVSVLNDESITIKVSENDNPYFETYSAWMETESGPYVKLNTWDADKREKAISGLNTLNRSYCIVVTGDNHCHAEQYPDNAYRHCTVELKAEGDSSRNLLNWSPYIGWDQVESYAIHTYSPTSDNWTFLSSVDGQTLNYTDSITSCATDRIYKVLAFEQGGYNETSYSDTAQATPLYGFHVPVPEVWRVTVEDDAWVLLEWIQQGKSVHPIQAVELVKQGGNSDYKHWGMKSPERKDTTDLNVEVDDRSYMYQLRAMDTCMNWSPWSTYGKTMVLHSTFDTEKMQPVLIWSRYGYWNEGVSHYLIEKRMPDGSFAVIGQRMGGTDTTFVDETAFEQCSPDFCYRITAVRNQPDNFPDSTHDVVSHSNVDCAMVQSHLYAPNAFTMNEDGLNETFQPVGMFISDYHLKIYNRWGELLFETDNCMEGWHGGYQGKDCPMGVYLYIINARGADQQSFNLHGTVHLLR